MALFANRPGIGMPEEWVPVNWVFPLVGFRLEARLAATGCGRGGYLCLLTVAVAGTWYR